MTCYHPLAAWRAVGQRTEAGKVPVVFARPSGPAEEIKVACGQCIGCRLARSKDWALRCVHEASLYEDNCFVTLTYDDDHLPPDGSLVKDDHQTFMRRLRKRFPVKKIRFFMCGEYGDSTMRPHYHFLLFNHDFWDKTEWMVSKGNTIFRSEELEKLWVNGYSWIGAVTWQSAAYVARYVLKKVNGEHAWKRYCRDVDLDSGECRLLEPEYICMSRRPGIAHAWYERYRSDCDKDYLTDHGRKYRVPRYYDQILELEDVEKYRSKKARRKEVAKATAKTPERLATLKRAQELAAKRLKRSL